MNKIIILNKLKKEFKISTLYLFGNVYNSKDIDILIVSNDFINISRSKRIMLVKKTSIVLDPICLTENEFVKLKYSESSLWSSILNNGYKIL